MVKDFLRIVLSIVRESQFELVILFLAVLVTAWTMFLT